MTVRQIIKKEKSSDENSCYLLKFKKYVKINREKFDSWRPKLVIETELLAYKDSYYTCMYLVKNTKLIFHRCVIRNLKWVMIFQFLQILLHTFKNEFKSHSVGFSFKISQNCIFFCFLTSLEFQWLAKVKYFLKLSTSQIISFHVKYVSDL